MYSYDGTAKEFPLNMVGSSTFGRYPKIATERTTNMFISDDFLVPYSGYIIGVNASNIGSGNGKKGRAIYTSNVLNRMIVVIDNVVYAATITFDQQLEQVESSTIDPIGNLSTSTGVVYIAENNATSVLISDNSNLYLYTPSGSPTFQHVTLTFTPGFITFHNDRYIAAQRFTNYWRLSDDGLSWPQSLRGPIESKPDTTQAVIRVPSKGNMLFVMGQNVTEAWFATGAQLFPYQRTNQFTIDYGCVSPASIAYMDEYVVWLAKNEKSGPIIMYSDGGMPTKITTDGIDYLLSNMQSPQDSQGFLFRQDGHLFYHINFYTDNYSLYYDFMTGKFFNACDQNFNYFIAAQVAFFRNQYYFVSRNTGHIYVFDTVFTTYQDTDQFGEEHTYIIPRMRICANIRGAKQNYFVLCDIGFIIESGETPLYNDSPPAIDLSLSYDGGASFGNQWRYELPTQGIRKNRVMWWQCGSSNDIVPQFMFWSPGRIVVTHGLYHIRE